MYVSEPGSWLAIIHISFTHHLTFIAHQMFFFFSLFYLSFRFETWQVLWWSLKHFANRAIFPLRLGTNMTTDSLSCDFSEEN